MINHNAFIARVLAVTVIVICAILFISPLATTEHDNTLYFDAQGGISFAAPSNFTLIGYKISAGQPWGGLGWTQGTTGILDVLAGRHKTQEVAQWFSNEFGSKMIGDNTTELSPTELNFAFIGTLTLSVNGNLIVLDNVGFAQGSNQTGNNWWAACKDDTCTLEAPSVLVFNVYGVCVTIAPEYKGDRFVIQSC